MNQPNQFNQPNIPPESPQPQPSFQPEMPKKPGLPAWASVLIIVLSVMIVGLVSYGAYWYFAPQPEPAELPTADEGEPTGEPADEMADWQVYRNEEYGFEVRYPNSIEVKEDKDTGESFSVEQCYVYFSYKNYKEGGKIFSIDVTREYSNLDEWNEEMNKFHSFLVSTEAVESFDRITFLGYPAIKIVYVGSPHSPRSGVLYFIKDGYSFMVTKSLEDDLEADQILSTFKFIE